MIQKYIYMEILGLGVKILRFSLEEGTLVMEAGLLLL